MAGSDQVVLINAQESDIENMDTEQIVISSTLKRKIALQSKAGIVLYLISYLKRYEIRESTAIRKIELKSKIDLERV